MTRPTTVSIGLIAATLLVAACAGPPTPAGTTSGSSAPERTGGQVSQNRVLTMVVRYEVTHMVPKIRTTANPATTKRVFNASLTLTDSGGSSRPYLAETVPQLNTDTWRVFPDGRMETTYKLRPGLRWHDGEALTAEDFAFSLRVYTNRTLGVFHASPQHLMDAVVVVDPRTFVIHWRSLYPDAADLRMEDFDPLPRHVLAEPYASFEQDPTQADAFLGLPYWMPEYVGAGPYRLVRWVPGSHFEGVAFDGHVLGRPRIERVLLRIMPDDNTVLSNILAGTMDYAALRFEHGLVAQRELVAAGKGVVVKNRGGAVTKNIQLRPEYVGHPALLDIRVRRALAHSLHRQGINDGVFEGQGFPTETMAAETEPFFPEVDRAIFKYPYDPRRTEQLMNEAGFVKDREELFANPAGERYRLDFVTVAGSEFERTQLIMADAWRRAGIDVQTAVLPSVQVRDSQQRHTFPGIATRGGALVERAFVSAEIGTPENRWTGDNRAGWSNPEYDRLWESFTTSLDRTERTRQFVAMQRLLSEHLPVFFTHFAVPMAIHVAALRVPNTIAAGGTGTLTPATLTYWDLHEWEWQ